MHQAFLDINGVRTNVMTYGRWVEEAPDPKESQEIIIIIPGNPGIPGFYKMFMHTLHEHTQLPVWIVGHAGHEMPKNNSIQPLPGRKSNESLYNLQGQIEHKIQFFEQYVPANAKVHLIGHSIGSFVILELLKVPEIKEKVVKVNLLFPTIEKMAETPHGQFLTTYIKPIVWLIVFLAWIFTILPSVLQGFLLYCYMRINSIPKMHTKAILQLIHPAVLDKIFFMAFEELRLVKLRDNNVIKDNINKIQLLYGLADGWAPKSFCDSIKKDIPGVCAETGKYEHSFVLTQSRQIGTLVGEWIKSK